MKVNAILLTIAAMAAVTTAFDEPSGDRILALSHGRSSLSFCGRPRHICLKRRSKFNTTDEAVGSIIGSCGVPGEPCYKVKRAALAINDILKRHAAMNPFCSSPNTLCEKQRRSLDEIAEVALDGYDDIVAREAEAEADADFFNFCAAPGSSCGWKRDTGAEQEHPQDLISHCDREGSFCARKRTAPEKRELHKRCALCFGGCTPAAKAQCKKIAMQKHKAAHKAAHPNGPITEAIPEVNHAKTSLHHKPLTKWPRPTTTIKIHSLGSAVGPKGNHKDFFNWCGAPGNVCNLKRDIHPADAKEAKKNFGPAFYEIRDALQTIKRDAEAEQGIEDPMDKIEHCKKSRCSPMTHAHLYARKNNGEVAEYAEDYAKVEGGLYDEIEPYFQDIEARVKRAIAYME